MWGDKEQKGLVFPLILVISALLGGVAEAALPTVEGKPDVWKLVTLQSYNSRLVILSTTLLGVTSGLVGVFLLLRKRSLMGDALSHATYPGIGLAFLVMTFLGGEGKWLPGLLLGASVTGVVGVSLVSAIRHTTLLKDDAAMGIILGVFFGAGVAIMKMVSNLPGADAAGLDSFVYGTAASLIFADFLLILVITGVVCGAAILLLKEFTLVCFDESFAISQGWPALRLDLIMLALVTAVTVVGLQAVGLVLIIAFLIIPAAAARFWSHKLHVMLLLAAAMGGASGWLGSGLSSLLVDLPTGAVIVLVAATIFMVSMLFGFEHGILPRAVRQTRLRRKVGRQHLLRAIYEILESRQPDTAEPVSNLPIDLVLLSHHRSWSPAELQRLLRTARGEDHLEDELPGRVRLSESGFGEAARVTRNHRLWELYLIRYADIAPSHVDRDADLVEHVLDADVVRQLELELQGRPVRMFVPPSPHLIDQPSG